MAELTLVSANKAYSSWSLRPWLALRAIGAPFDEAVIPLRRDDTAAMIAKHSPTGKVPVLHHRLPQGTVTIWESLAILEYVAELYPEAGLWPGDPHARAVARAVSAEMHAGFTALRSQMPMNVRRTYPARGRTPEALADIARIIALWRDCRERFGTGGGGPFLFGAFGIADAMFAPVATRLRTYAVEPELDGPARVYVELMLSLPPMQEWYAAAQAEPWTIEAFETA